MVEPTPQAEDSKQKELKQKIDEIQTTIESNVQADPIKYIKDEMEKLELTG